MNIPFQPGNTLLPTADAVLGVDKQEAEAAPGLSRWTDYLLLSHHQESFHPHCEDFITPGDCRIKDTLQQREGVMRNEEARRLLISKVILILSLDFPVPLSGRETQCALCDQIR